ncbi:lactate/malate family dehydrogenase [Loigolactobacillus jiayinensis]|uniref:NAD-binding protein n=1 Tax=Loigolactobacillus jiayinensis TaxID=2486016 RepID=A0ABW1RDQ8_9LACO|nr:NAD-binding protein [Loigolactobacillus jiayinensis]
MKRIGIIGVGHVGSTVAYTLVRQQLCTELVLFDKNSELTEAERHDLMAGQVGQHSSVKIMTLPVEQVNTCDLVIFAAGDISILQHSTDRFAELNYTKTVVAEWAPRLRANKFTGLILNITNPCDVITQYLQKLTGLPHKRVFGTGTTLDTARMQVTVSEQLAVATDSVTGYVLGEHGNSQFVAWSSVCIAGNGLTERFTQTELDHFEELTSKGAWTTISGKGYTSYGIANQAAVVVAAITTNAHAVLPVTNYAVAEQCYLGHPAVVTREGIERDFTVPLNAAEQEKWRLSVDKIKQMTATI